MALGHVHRSRHPRRPNCHVMRSARSHRASGSAPKRYPSGFRGFHVVWRRSRRRRAASGARSQPRPPGGALTDRLSVALDAEIALRASRSTPCLVKRASSSETARGARASLIEREQRRRAQPLPPIVRQTLMRASVERAGRWLSWGGRALARLVAPDHCAACDAPVHGVEPFCEECGPCLPAADSLPLGAVVAGAYAPPLSTAIGRLKFGRRTDLADRLSLLLPDLELAEEALVVPVPLHVERLAERGFNAPALLARCWCRRLGAAFAPSLLSRWRETPHQLHLSRAERARNVVGAFVARPDAAGRQVILLDDVVTTGATLASCRAALYAAGVVHVTVVALAATSLARGWEASRARIHHALYGPTPSTSAFRSLGSLPRGSSR